MDCKQVKNNLIFYHYGELSPQQSEEIKKHLQTCQSCAADYQKLSAVLDYAAAEARSEPNPYIWTRVKARLEQSGEYTPVPAWVRVLQPVLLVALVVVGLFLGIQLGNLYTRPDLSGDLAMEQLENQDLFISLNSLDNSYFIINDE